MKPKNQHTAAESVQWLLDNPYQFAGTFASLQAQAIREVLPRLPDSRAPYVVFLKAAVDAGLSDARLEKAWREALQGVLDLNVSYPLGSPKRRAKMAGLISNPVLLHATQAAVVVAEKAERPMLELLVADGTDGSVDALMPFFARATAEKGRALDLLEGLRKHAAKTRALSAMFDEARALLTVRNAASPALALAATLGLGQLTSFSFSARVGSTQLTGGHVPQIQGSVDFDSTSDEWFSVWLASVDLHGVGRATRFGSKGPGRDGLKLGRCEAADAPVWLAKAAKTLRITWDDSPSVSSSLRGSKRQQVLEWLMAHSNKR